MRRSRLVLVGAAAALAVVLVAAIAVAKSYSLKVEKNVHVTNEPTKAFRVKPVNKHEAVAVGPAGYAVYAFQGETTHHIICQKTSQANTNCWAFWPPVSPGSATGITKQAGISGKLGSFHNHGQLQLTLNGQPLYYFNPDLQSGNKQQATGDELKTFGSIWHVVVASTGATRGATSPQPPVPTNTTTTPTPPPYMY
jgi:predicted lipoprotein with Yx(FWY)xxD motif